MRAFVDRIESGIATLLLGEDESVTVRVPTSLLPARVREGDILRVNCTIDDNATEQAKRDTRTILESLPDEP